MVAAHRQSNETLVLLQCAANASCGSIRPMRSFATTSPSAAPSVPAPDGAVARLQAELTVVRVERDQLRGVLADVLAELAQLRAQLADTQAQLATVEAERQATRQELVDLKRAPFVPRQRQTDGVAGAKPRGRPRGHTGSGRLRPTRIDHTQAIPAPDTCPDCGTAFTGTGVIRERVVEDIALVRPTVITKYLIERRWCPNCRTYHEDVVTDALPDRKSVV